MEKPEPSFPVSFSHPCFDCKKAEALYKELKDPFLLKISLNNCIDNCPNVEYFTWRSGGYMTVSCGRVSSETLLPFQVL